MTAERGLAPRPVGGFVVQVARCRVPASLANHPEPTLIVDPPTGELGRHVRMEVAVLLFGGPYRTVTQALFEAPRSARPVR